MFLTAQAGAVTYRFSVDLGGDEDLSDPAANGNEWMDCGDIYVEGANYMNPPPTRVKDDDGPVGIYTGHPFALGGAPQPAAGNVGNCTTAAYACNFDLDAEDQLAVEVFQPTMPVAAVPGGGVYIEPTQIDFSYEDDGPLGWAVTGDVPTTALPDHGSAAASDEVMIDVGPFGVWSPPTVTPVRSEFDLGLATAPAPTADDEDVDALDKEEHQYFYWSPDHEANMGLDPGDIFMTDLFWAGANQFLALDDVNNIGLTQGLHDTADVDAWEFCAVMPATYTNLFGGGVGGPTLIGLFSVDSDDLDTPGIDESGGLNPNQIYATNLIGQFVPLAVYAEDVDALTVPEPATLALLGLGGLALLRRRK
jgi:hypothetical protein